MPARCWPRPRGWRRWASDAITVSEGAKGSARMSALSLAVLLQQGGFEPVLQYQCRDRYLLGMQSDLLGAHATGIRNVLLVTGDPRKRGDYSDATLVFDVDSIGLANAVTRLNRGRDVGGQPIGGPTAFHVGVVGNPDGPAPGRRGAAVRVQGRGGRRIRDHAADFRPRRARSRSWRRRPTCGVPILAAVRAVRQPAARRVSRQRGAEPAGARGAAGADARGRWARDAPPRKGWRLPSRLPTPCVAACRGCRWADHPEAIAAVLAGLPGRL